MRELLRPYRPLRETILDINGRSSSLFLSFHDFRFYGFYGEHPILMLPFSERLISLSQTSIPLCEITGRLSKRTMRELLRPYRPLRETILDINGTVEHRLSKRTMRELLRPYRPLRETILDINGTVEHRLSKRTMRESPRPY